MSSTTIVAIPNIFPFNDLWLDRKLIAKTRSWEWKHRGLALLYTSASRIDRYVCEQFDLDPKSAPHGKIVGAVNIADVRMLSKDELKTLVRQYNPKVPAKKLPRPIKYSAGNPFYGWEPYCGFCYPLHYGLFADKLVRFDEPIAFKWPQGRVRTADVPMELVTKELKKHGLRV